MQTRIDWQGPQPRSSRSQRQPPVVAHLAQDSQLIGVQANDPGRRPDGGQLVGGDAFAVAAALSTNSCHRMSPELQHARAAGRPVGTGSWIGGSALSARGRVSGARAGYVAALASAPPAVGGSIGWASWPPLIGTCRGLAASATGIVSVSTPSRQLACTRSASSASPRKTWRA
jgi:hypothetical protein